MLPLSRCVARTRKKLSAQFLVHVVIKDPNYPLGIIRIVSGELAALSALQEIYTLLAFQAVASDLIFGKISSGNLLYGVSIFGRYYPRHHKSPSGVNSIGLKTYPFLARKLFPIVLDFPRDN